MTPSRAGSWVLPAVLLLAACEGEIQGTGPADAAGGGSDRGGGSGKGGKGGSSGASGSTGKGGSSTGGAGGTSGGAAGNFQCDESAAAPPASLRRLTMTQYRNTVRDLVAWATGSATRVPAVETALERLPEDRREPTEQDLHGSYRRLDQTLQQVHVDTIYAVGGAVGTALTTSSLLGTVVGSCATDTQTNNDAACLDDFIRRFGARALRRPVTDEEVTFYHGVYGTNTAADPLAYADVVAVFLNTPDFVYFAEHGDAEVAERAGTYRLSANELASRLSYQLWQTAPDEALASRAADESLLDAAVYEAEVDRMLADPRSRAVLDDFFADWMKVEDLPELDAKNADPVFSAFAGEDLPDDTLRGAMIEDVVGMLDHYAWSEPESLSSILLSEKSFAKDDALARIYGVPVWNGTSEPPSFPAGERPGLLTRALFLTTGSANTRPIMKGVFMRKTVLCDDIPPPPADANASPPELSPDMTTREVVEAITEMPDTTCAGCHATLINPLGFATESFDALGRHRLEQKLLDAEGNVVGTKPVDTSGTPSIIDGDETPVSGALELMTLVAASGKAEACLARNYFRFTFARWEDLAKDGCTLEALRARLAAGGTFQDLLRETVLADAFKERTFE